MYKNFYRLNEWIDISDRHYKKDASLPQDGYFIRVDKDGSCAIHYQNDRAKLYAQSALAEQKQNGKYPVMELMDYPSFPLRGVVEGFYGKPYSHEQRMALMPLLRSLKMNTYIYAPKDDLFHRDRWREDYPENEAARLQTLFDFALRNHIDFYFAISPGKDFDYANEAEYEILLRKLKKVQAMGIDKFALLMDDIEAKLTDAQTEKFDSVAHAHAHLCNYLVKKLSPKASFLFCPTDYMQNFETPYRVDLRKYLDSTVGVFWTGYNTVAEIITEADGEEVAKNFGRKTVLWDNYPVNDFEPKRRIYFGAIDGRGRRLQETHVGYVANLSELYECSKIPLATMADYAWDCDGYNAQKSLERAIEGYFRGCKRAGKTFVKENEANIMSAPIRRKRLFLNGNFRVLDLHYKREYDALAELEKKAPSAFLTETEALRSFMKAECELYGLFRQGKVEPVLSEYAQKLNGSKYAPYDLSFLEYLNERFAPQTPFKVDADRFIYRSWRK